jgi:hypothetical protein
MMGERMAMQDSLFYEFRLELHRPAVGGPGSDDPDADRRLVLRDPL